MSDGELKFTVKVENWPWTEDGRFLEIEIIVKVPPGRRVSKRKKAEREPGRPDSFSLGKNATAFFSRKVSAHNQTISQSISQSAFITYGSE